MQSILTVTAAASDLSLLTLDEARSAARAPSASDEDMTKLVDRVSADIVKACGVAAAGITPPTLRQETLQEVFRGVRRASRLTLARKPVVSITSIVEDGVTLTGSDYELDAAARFLRRLSGDCVVDWCATKITIVYVAGWDTVPAGLKLAAERLASHYWSQQQRDPLVKSESIPDVIEQSYWVGDTTDGAGMPRDVLSTLTPYMVVAGA